MDPLLFAPYDIISFLRRCSGWPLKPPIQNEIKININRDEKCVEEEWPQDNRMRRRSEETSFFFFFFFFSFLHFKSDVRFPGPLQNVEVRSLRSLKVE